MRSSTCLVAIGLLGACSNSPLAMTLTAPSPAPAPDVFQCARAQLKAIQFDQSSIDLNDQRLTARRYDLTARRPDVQFRRLVERLEIQAIPGDGQAMTTLKVTARTFAEYTTQRGPTEEQERTSETARDAAQTIVQKCVQPVDSLSVPG
jgi:hypothetical protein